MTAKKKHPRKPPLRVRSRRRLAKMKEQEEGISDTYRVDLLTKLKYLAERLLDPQPSPDVFSEAIGEDRILTADEVYTGALAEMTEIIEVLNSDVDESHLVAIEDDIVFSEES